MQLINDRRVTVSVKLEQTRSHCPDIVLQSVKTMQTSAPETHIGTMQGLQRAMLRTAAIVQQETYGHPYII